MTIQRTCDLLTEEEIEITENYDAVALLEKMALGNSLLWL
jgi:hypothetical protein